MPSEAVSGLARAQRLASGAHVAAIVAAVLIGVMIVAQGVEAVMAFAASEAEPLARLNSALLPLIPVLPLVYAFAAMFRLRQALDHYSDGAFFSAKASRHVAEAGAHAAIAVVASAVIVPVIQAWVAGDYGGFHVRIEPFTVAMFAFALFVMIVGRILEAAGAIKAENDEIV